MMKKLVIAAFAAINCLAAHAAGIQAEHVVTHLEQDHERVEVGLWIQDEAGHVRHEIDDWTQIVNPTEHVVWSANSKRGRYSEAPLTFRMPPMGTPLIDSPGSLNAPGAQEVSRIDLGTREINGIECEGVLVELVVSSGRGGATRFEFEAWKTEAFSFPFNVKFSVRTQDGEQTTQLQDIVELTDAELEGRFRPDDDWKEARFQIVRTTAAWTGFWPFTDGGSKVTGTVSPWPRRERDW